MEKEFISLSPDLDLPLNAVTQRVAFIGRTGSGKTFTAQKFAEELLSAKAQVVIVDPVGNWYGLRLDKTGKGKSRFDIPVLGGLHGDIALEPSAGAMVADLIVDRRLSVILDVSSFRKERRKQFLTDFAEQFFHKKKSARSAVHLFIEEAQLLVPQRAVHGEERMLGAFEDLVRLGRNYGIGVSLISQRPQSVNKEVLNMTECLFVLQVNGAQERKALTDWIVEKRIESKEVVDELPGLPVGTAYVWSPQWLRILKKVKISRKQTYDASATPEIGDDIVETAKLSPVDLEQLEQAMQTVIAETKANDPKLLKAEIAQLKRQLGQGAPVKIEQQRIEIPVFKDGEIDRLEAVVEKIMVAGQQFRESAQEIGSALKAAPSKKFELPVSTTGTLRPLFKDISVNNAMTIRQHNPLHDEIKLRAGEYKMLQALGQRHPDRYTKAQLATLSGFAKGGGTYSTYLGVLKRLGFVEGKDSLGITEAGLQYLGTDIPSSPTTTSQMLALWQSRLRAGEIKMLNLLVENYPKGIHKVNLGEETGFASNGGTFSTYLGVLKRNGLIEVNDGYVSASPSLFIG